MVEGDGQGTPRQLLKITQDVDREGGRVRTRRWGPRVIDIDILLYGSAQVHAARLEIPHPRMHERRFVLAPMVELAPDLRHPELHRTMRDLLAGFEGQRVRKVDFTPRKIQ